MLKSIKIPRNIAFSGSDKPRMLFFLLINVKMPAIFFLLINVEMPTTPAHKLLAFMPPAVMSRKNFMLSRAEHNFFLQPHGQ